MQCKFLCNSDNLPSGMASYYRLDAQVVASIKYALTLVFNKHLGSEINDINIAYKTILHLILFRGVCCNRK